MIGIDIVKIDRISRLVNKFGKRGLEKFLSEDEIKNAKSVESIAGLWASKEAFSKALGTGIGKEVSFKDIEILKDKRGKPYVKVSERLKKDFNIKDVDVSISHDGGFVIAAVIILKL